MNKASSIVAALVSFAASALAYDGQINIGPTPGAIGTTPSGGGPFTVTVTSSLTPVMSQVVSAGNPFLAFCLEYSEHITLSNNQGYYVNVSNQAINGGGGPNPDPVSLVTAYLYSQYRAGTNPNVPTTPTGAANLQNAIWWMEQELGNDATAATTGGAALITYAKGQLGLGALTDAALRATDANGAYGVRVLNVYSNPQLTSLNQDMLAMVPEPSTYAAAALLMVPVLMQARRMRRSA